MPGVSGDWMADFPSVETLDDEEEGSMDTRCASSSAFPTVSAAGEIYCTVNTVQVATFFLSAIGYG